MDTGDHRGQGQVQGLGELGQGRGLADPRFTPQEYGQVGGDGEGQCLQLAVGTWLGTGVTEQGRQGVGHVELGDAGRIDAGVEHGGFGAVGHVDGGVGHV